jgi:hypothetical protein
VIGVDLEFGEEGGGDQGCLPHELIRQDASAKKSFSLSLVKEGDG